MSLLPSAMACEQ